MAFKIIMAKTPELLDKAFKLRHHVFVEEEGLLQPTSDGRLVDRFDAYPTTSTLVVTTGEAVVGTFRLCLDSSEGLPADEYYDFHRHVPQDSRLMHGGLFCVSRTYRDPKCTTSLMLMASYFAESHNVTHIVAPINPKIAKLLRRIGFRVIGEEFIEPHTGAAMLPLLLDLRELNDFFLNFIKHNQLQDFLRDYERWFYKTGEVVVQAGEIGQEAFIIIEGSAQVTLPETDRVIAELGAGDVFGELALLTDEPRSADIVATTDLQVMVLSKAVFVSHFLNQPKQALNLLRLMSKRTQSLISQLEERC